MRWRNLSWTTRLTIVMTALTIVPLLTLAIYNRVSSQRGLFTATSVNNLQRARGTAGVIDAYLSNIAAEIQSAAVSPYAIGLAQRPGDRDAMALLVSQLKDLHEIEKFDDVFAVDRRGIVIASTRPDLTGANVIAKRWFLTAAAGQTVVDDPELDERTQTYALHVSSPMRRPNEPIAGVLVGTVPMSALERYVALDTNFGGSGEFGTLWNVDGIRLAVPAMPELRFTAMEPLAPYAQLLARRRFGPSVEAPAPAAQDGVSIGDRSRWLLFDRRADPHARVDVPGTGAAHVAMVPLTNKRWIYGVFTPEERLIAALDARTRRDLLIAVLVGVIAAALSVIVAARIAQPLLRIGRTAQDIAHGDLSRRVGLRQSDEVGQVAAAFDQMLDALAAKDAQLQGRAEQLERRVEERTAELQALYRQAQEANRLKDEFLGTVSHELRTPLNAILGWSRMLRTHAFDAPRAARALNTIERNAQAQAQLVDDLLDVSRIISGKLRLDVRSVDLGAVVAGAIDALRPAAEAKRLDLRASIDPRTAGVLGDPHRLQQVVWNLLSNAIKFTPEGGRVLIDAERDGDNVQIRVVDSGAGIEPEFLPHVFDRFSQADSSTTRKHGGLGLGLAIVRHLVELHGGIVSAQSGGRGSGATFTVRLPMSAAHRIASAAPDAPQSAPHLAGVRVLVVDDEADGRELAATVLERHGAKAITATSTRDALAHMAAERFAVVVTDIAMPVEDGFALLALLRTHPDASVRAVPVVALTAYAAEQDRQRVLASGFQGYLAKPAEPADLVRTVAAAITAAVGAEIT